VGQNPPLTERASRFADASARISGVARDPVADVLFEVEVEEPPDRVNAPAGARKTFRH